MGLTNKLVTKARTAAKSESARLPRPWNDSGYLAAAAIVRAVVTTIGQQELKSSGFVGRDYIGIKSDRLASTSTIWAHQDGVGQWLIALGKDTVAGPTYDWQIRLTITDNLALQTATVETLSFIASDGTLLNKDSHGELRTLLLSSLASGRLPFGRAEAEISSASLPAETPKPYVQHAVDATIRTTITTTLAATELDQQLRLVPFLSVEGSQQERAWLLTDETERLGDRATATITDNGARCSIELTCALQASGNQIRDFRVAERAYALPRSILRAIKERDPDATLTNEVQAAT